MLMLNHNQPGLCLMFAMHTLQPSLLSWILFCKCSYVGVLLGPGGAAAANEVALGSPKNPIHMLQAEPGFKVQLWRTVRALALGFVVVAGLGALVEDKGLTRGILNNPDLRPQMDSKTKFSDVKGVDEAKVISWNILLVDGLLLTFCPFLGFRVLGLLMAWTAGSG